MCSFGTEARGHEKTLVIKGKK